MPCPLKECAEQRPSGIALNMANMHSVNAFDRRALIMKMQCKCFTGVPTHYTQSVVPADYTSQRC